MTEAARLSEIMDKQMKLADENILGHSVCKFTFGDGKIYTMTLLRQNISMDKKTQAKLDSQVLKQAQLIVDSAKAEQIASNP